MKQDEHKTKVIFRKEFPERGGEIIAVFPELPGDSNPYRTCLSYMHTGQHGAIALDYTEWTFPARESSMNYKHESRKLTGFYLAAIGFALILWAALQALN